jgi:Mn2+/Fe2+ NRAMP family transporter
LAGDGATVLFAIGFIGTGLLSIPVLAGSSAYAVAEIFGWREGLGEKPQEAPQFYAVIAIATLIGLALSLSGIGAIRALFVAAVINGVAAPILIATIVTVSNDERVLGKHRNGWLASGLGWAAAGLMGLAAIGMLFAFALG